MAGIRFGRIGGKWRGFVIAAAAAAIVLPAAPAAAQKYTMKFGTATVAGDQNEWMARFEERVEKRAGDRIEIQLYPSSQLGSIPRTIEGMQLGTVEAWIGPPAFVKGVDPRYQIVDAPGLFRDVVHGQKTLTDPEFHDPFLAAGEAKGVKGLGLYASGTVAVVTTKRPIRRVEDYRGLKLRVLASEMEVEALERLGAAAVPMPLLDVLPALQQGALDGVKSALVVFIPFKYWSVAPYLTETGEGIVPVTMFVGKSWWDSLPGDLRGIMTEEARKLENEMHAWSLEYRKRLRKIWVENGGELVEFPDSERAEMMQRLATVSEEVVSRNPAIADIYALMVKVSKKY